MKNILLYDFNDSDIDQNIIDSGVNDLFEKVNTIGVLYGELDPTDDLDIMAKNVSHGIKNLQFIDNKIYGDVEILMTKSGNIANFVINKGIDYELKMRHTITNSKLIIFTWELIINEEL